MTKKSKTSKISNPKLAVVKRPIKFSNTGIPVCWAGGRRWDTTYKGYWILNLFRGLPRPMSVRMSGNIQLGLIPVSEGFTLIEMEGKVPADPKTATIVAAWQIKEIDKEKKEMTLEEISPLESWMFPPSVIQGLNEETETLNYFCDMVILCHGGKVHVIPNREKDSDCAVCKKPAKIHTAFRHYQMNSCSRNCAKEYFDKLTLELLAAEELSRELFRRGIWTGDIPDKSKEIVKSKLEEKFGPIPDNLTFALSFD